LEVYNSFHTVLLEVHNYHQFLGTVHGSEACFGVEMASLDIHNHLSFIALNTTLKGLISTAVSPMISYNCSNSFSIISDL
jgi:hypothetical protein